MEYFNTHIIEDIRQIYVPTILALIAVYLPIFVLSIWRISTWILTIPIVIYLLLIPTCSFIRTIPMFNICVAGLGIYNAQKICEWLLIRENEFRQWSFFDIHHELFYYLVYTKHVSLKNFNKTKKQIFFTGPIQYHEHFNSLIYLSYRIIRSYLLLDLLIYLLTQILTTDLYERYFFLRILINQSSGCIVYLFLSMNYDIARHTLCLFFNRPLQFIPDLFRQPYRAISPSDFWSRWHQIFKNTWIELIFKPTSTILRPHLSKFVSDGISSMFVFLFSGLVHEYTVYITLNKISGDQMKFFFLQGLAVLIEHALKQQFHIPESIGFLFTFLFNGMTSGYFLKPWLVYFKKKQIVKYSLIDFLRRNLFT